MRPSSSPTAPEPPHGSLRQARLDRVGTIASLACAVHCALMPFLLAILPAALGASLASDAVEWGLFGASAFLGLACMHRGGKLHRRGMTKGVFAVGLTMLAFGRVSEERGWGHWGVAALVLGGVTVATAHALNGRLCRVCALCHNPPKPAV